MTSIGPGSPQYMAPRGFEALQEAEVIVGYKTYIELIKDIVPDKEILSTGMRKEMERCIAAVEEACKGRKVAIVSSGDAGIYGMAGLVLEICLAKGLTISSKTTQGDCDIYLEVIPGIPALCAGAALLGAPLMHDFASISLSDLLTPWELIKKRVEHAAKADFVLVIYNPKSKRRDWQLDEVQRILLDHRTPETPVGIVQKAMRKGEEVTITNLREFTAHPVDMQTIIIIGNSKSYATDAFMITPRGYFEKYDPQKYT